MDTSGPRLAQPAIFTRAEARGSGYTDADVVAELKAGRWMRVRRGSYSRASEPATGSRKAEHVLRARQVAAALSPESVLSHQSAVLLHGFPLWGAPLVNVHVTRLGRTSSRLRAGVHSHRKRLDGLDVVVASGIGLTALERSMLDLACTAGFESAVCSMDAALRCGRVSKESLTASASRLSRCAGAGLARRAIAFADGRAESVGESRLRVAIHELGLPTPVPQQQFVDSGGRVIGRVDLWWPDQRTIVEFDGLVKYRGSMGQPIEVLVAEKRREDELRSLTGARFVRVVWAELADRETLGRTLGRALDGG